MKQLLLLTTLLMIGGLWFLIWKWPQSISKTFSQHAAAQKESIIYYAALFIVTLPLLILFTIKWFVPHFVLNNWFTGLILFAAVTQLGCVLIPEVAGWKREVHRFLALLSAIALLPAMAIVISNHSISSAGHIASAISLVAMLGIFVTVSVSGAKHKYFLILQGSYFALFFLALLTATYTS